jgi:hypothetical protein
VFLTRSDLPPLLVLMVALTGRNGETVKELPAAHRLLDGRAAGVAIIKRRRGPGRWSGQAVWEIGPPGRRMYPGCVVPPGARADGARPAVQGVTVTVVGLAQ